MLALAPMHQARAASFPCAKATTADEKAICRTPALNDSDVELATRYSMVLQLLPMGGAGALRDSQVKWLADRRLCGGKVACLQASYAGRIAEVKSVFQQIVSRGPY